MKTPAHHTAYHEAGHAVVAWAQDAALFRATIERDGKILGSVAHANLLKGLNPDLDVRPTVEHRLKKLVRIALAGGIAQRKFKPRSHRTAHDRADREHAVDLTTYITGSPEHTNAYLKLLYFETEELVAKHWNIIEAVARELMERKTMSGKEIEAAIIAENDRAYAEHKRRRNAGHA